MRPVQRFGTNLCLAAAMVLWLIPACARAQDDGKIGATIDPNRNITFPKFSQIIDVTQAPYNAKGDGRTDDTAALQQALADHMGQHDILYLPNGTYLVSATLKWSKRDARGREAWGFNWIQGQSSKTVIRLKDGTFTDSAKPQSIMWCGGFGSADWFHNYIQDVTFDVGSNNPGAIGLQFYSNNSGAVRNVLIKSEDTQGAIGLDLAHRDMNGPLLVRDVIVQGFDVGIACGHSVNSQTFEHITLSGQKRTGIVNDGQPVAIRGLRSENSVPALRATSRTCLLDSELSGTGAASGVAAIQLGKASFYARDVHTRGYRSAVASEAGNNQAGPDLDEFIQGSVTNPFGGPVRSLRLPVKETPDVPWDDPSHWAVVETPADRSDSSAAVQQAIDSGATTVLLGHGLKLHSPVHIRGNVRRIIGTGGEINYGVDASPDFIIEDGTSPLLVIEHLSQIGGGVILDTSRTVVFRSVETHVFNLGRGDLFMEDFCTGDLRINLTQNAWARQLNIENEGTHLTNEGGKLWILGYKTERGGTLIHTVKGGQTELFGTFSYTTTRGDLAPMFVVEDSSMFAFFDERHYGTEPFATLIRERRDDQVKVVKRGDGDIAPYISTPNSR